MKRLTVIYVVVLLFSVIFAAWGVIRWLQAREFTMRAPAPLAAAARYSYLKPERYFPLSRYAGLQKGSLFFGPESGETPTGGPAGPKGAVKFSSKLLLYGVAKGTDSRRDRAVVGLTGASKRTWLVQPGTVVNGETVVGIEARGIWVKNATGKGRVALKPK